MMPDQLNGLCVYIRVDQFMERLIDDLPYLFDFPALAQFGEIVAGTNHLLVVGSADLE